MSVLKIVEDDAAVARLLEEGARYAGLEAEIFQRSSPEMHTVPHEPSDVLLIDDRAYEGEGLAICRAVRGAAGVQPLIIALASSDSDVEEAVSFEIGADDVARKPFDAAEVISRVAVLQKRVQRSPSVRDVAHSSMRINREVRTVSADGGSMTLSPMELELLVYLVLYAGRSFGKVELFQAVWGYEHPEADRTVDGHITRLRRKLGSIGVPPELVTIVHGIGYSFAKD